MPLDWPTRSGTVNFTGDTVEIGASSSAKRSLAIPATRGPIHVVIHADVSGAGCRVTLHADPGGWSQTVYVSDGTDVLTFSGLPNPPRTLTELELSCAVSGSMEVDWISIQNSGDVVMPPGNEIAFEWEDVDAPGGGLHTAVVRPTTGDYLVAGTDVGGIGIKDLMDPDTPWRVINGGLGADFDQAVWDVAGVNWVPDSVSIPELYALTGLEFSDELFGGLWRSDDLGETWELVADTLIDGVGYYGRADECNDKYYGGGRVLLPDESSQVLYVASNWIHQYYDFDTNNTPQRETGVYLWDDDASPQLCSLPTSDLPSDQYISSLAISETGGADPDPVLLVGYKGSGPTKYALYACTLPDDTSAPGESTLDCTSTSTVSCVPVPESLGLDIRDIEVDVNDPSIVYVADGGDDPSAGSAACAAGAGGLYALSLDALGPTWIGDIGDPGWNTAKMGITGLSMDPDGGFLFAFIPSEDGTLYGDNSMYRIAAADIGDPYAWEAIDDVGDGSDRAAGSDFSGAWLEATTVVKPVPEPWLWTSLLALDAVWFRGDLGEPLAVVTTGNSMWLVEGLADPSPGWDGEDDTTWTFWPEADASHPRGFSSMSSPDAAVDSFGNLWMATGDHGLLMLPEGAPASERDCLFELYRAGGYDVAVGLDDSVWLSLREQVSNVVPHRMGVFRTLDQGATWGYQGAGVTIAQTRYSLNNAAWCRDHDLTHMAQPLDGDGGGTAFTVDPAARYSVPTDPMRASLGNGGAIDALDARMAVLVLQAYMASNGDDPAEVYDMPGGLAYTLDGGATWTVAPFDGVFDADPNTADCDEKTFFGRLPDVSLVGRGTSTYWEDSDADGVLDPQEDWQIEAVLAANMPGASKECSLARVKIDAGGAEWNWYKLDRTASGEYGGCRVDVNNISGVIASPWSREAFVWGGYSLVRLPFIKEYGGVCAVDLVTGAAQVIISPATSDNLYEQEMMKVVPHPQVDGLLFVVTGIGANSMAECSKVFIDTYGTSDICPSDPVSFLATRTGGGWVVDPVWDLPPAAVGRGGTWGRVDDGLFYFVSKGAGTWKGTMSW